MPNLADTRWYLYRSTPKIELLHEQMSGGAKSSKTLTIATPIASGSLGLEQGPVGIETKLREVERQLESDSRIGTLDEPGEYVHGVMRMRWGMFDDGGARHEQEAPCLFFAGLNNTAEPLLVALGGSSVNMLGNKGASSTHSRSYTGAISKWLLAAARDFAPPSLPDWWDMEAERHAVFAGIAIALNRLRPPTLNLEFVAKVLSMGTLLGYEQFIGVESTRVILATPLWVAEVAPYFEDDIHWGLEADLLHAQVSKPKPPEPEA